MYCTKTRTTVVRPRAPDTEEERQVRDDRCGESARHGTQSRRRTDEHERRGQRRDERPDVEALAMARDTVRGVRAQLRESCSRRELGRRNDERDLRDLLSAGAGNSRGRTHPGLHAVRGAREANDAWTEAGVDALERELLKVHAVDEPFAGAVHAQPPPARRLPKARPHLRRLLRRPVDQALLADLRRPRAPARPRRGRRVRLLLLALLLLAGYLELVVRQPVQVHVGGGDGPGSCSRASEWNGDDAHFPERFLEDHRRRRRG